MYLSARNQFLRKLGTQNQRRRLHSIGQRIHLGLQHGRLRLQNGERVYWTGLPLPLVFDPQERPLRLLVLTRHAL